MGYTYNVLYLIIQFSSCEGRLAHSTNECSLNSLIRSLNQLDNWYNLFKVNGLFSDNKTTKIFKRIFQFEKLQQFLKWQLYLSRCLTLPMNAYLCQPKILVNKTNTVSCNPLLSLVSKYTQIKVNQRLELYK